ncbi:hypothetical protein [Kineococcus siccus]|uniref:hypothetical protein n=1 Tax=Kineococcus siccus TaxID=2696567 RepID=UPI003B83059D
MGSGREFEGSGARATEEEYRVVFADYYAAIDGSENHSDGDYSRILLRDASVQLTAASEKRHKRIAGRQAALTYAPYLSVAAAALFITPYILWLLDG